MLIKAGCDINERDKNKWTPLMNACYWANEEAVLALLKSGADPNIKNIDGRTALHEVCRSPTKKEDVLAKIAVTLIKNGSDVNLTSSSQVGYSDFYLNPNKLLKCFLANFQGGFECADVCSLPQSCWCC
jgi:ankyrin repeat protein